MSKKVFCLVSDLNDSTLLALAGRVGQELELRGLPDVSFKQGYKAGFLAALRDENLGLCQVWEASEIEALYQDLERRFAA
ncbi:MAG: hypothetical protein KKA46_14985 [Proteobacteria bacterium]|nr:hypothetical protein [Pseudomonadota bacterium]